MDEPPQGGWSPAHDAALTADVLLLRHGETRLTPEQRFSGVAGEDPGLSPRGRTQAQLAAASTLLRQKPFTHILSSPLTRCRETADILASEMGSPVTVDENLREMDFGQWEGMTYAEVEQRFPTDLAQWQRSPDVAPTGSGETFSAVLHRAALVADHFASSYAGASVIAVTHVTPVKALVAHALGAPPLALFAIQLSPAGFTRITYAGSTALVRLMNETVVGQFEQVGSSR